MALHVCGEARISATDGEVSTALLQITDSLSRYDAFGATYCLYPMRDSI